MTRPSAVPNSNVPPTATRKEHPMNVRTRWNRLPRTGKAMVVTAAALIAGVAALTPDPAPAPAAAVKAAPTTTATPKPTPTVTRSAATAPKPAARVLTPDETYLDLVHRLIPATRYRSNATVIDAGRQSCAALDGGATAQQLVNAAALRGADPGNTRSVLLAAATAYCPKHLDAVL